MIYLFLKFQSAAFVVSYFRFPRDNGIEWVEWWSLQMFGSVDCSEINFMLCTTLKQKMDEMAHSCILNNIGGDDLKNNSTLLRIPCIRYKPLEETNSLDLNGDWAYFAHEELSTPVRTLRLLYLSRFFQWGGKDPRQGSRWGD